MHVPEAPTQLYMLALCVAQCNGMPLNAIECPGLVSVYNLVVWLPCDAQGLQVAAARRAGTWLAG